MKINAEFHCHSLASDGKMTPTEVIRVAKELNLKSIALTDHDTTAGLEEAAIEAKKLEVTFIPGIELSCNYKGATIHLLGYFKDDSYKNPKLQEFLENLKIKRVDRAIKIVENLDKYFDIKIDYNKVLEKGNGVIARPHIAKTIIEAGYDYEWDYIFEKFIGDDSPAYVPNEKLHPADGTKLLKEYNAIVVLAHPKLITKVPVNEILDFGVDGIEAIYFQNTNDENSHYVSLAESRNLLITCGSDCHGNSKEDSKHGYIGDMSIPDFYYDKFIKEYKKI